jgi:hypothetical protein
LTAIIRCQCNNYTRTRWSTQGYIPNTNLHTGNVALAAASVVAPVAYVDLDSLSRAASIPMFSKMSFLRYSKSFVFPSIENMYSRNQTDLYSSIGENIEISVDGAYDSPGFTAEYCTVSAIEMESKQVLEISTIQKKECQNISARMEPEGVKRVLDEITDRQVSIENVTTDKNPSVCKLLKDRKISYAFDCWHLMKKMQKEIRAESKKIANDKERGEFKALGRRLMLHFYNSVENSEGRVRIEKMLSFFLHVQGIHSWNNDNFSDIIQQEERTKTGTLFTNGHFENFFSCDHQQDYTSAHELVESSSHAFQFLLEMVTKNIFLDDLVKIQHGHATSENESFNNICIIYHPKRKFYSFRGFQVSIYKNALQKI